MQIPPSSCSRIKRIFCELSDEALKDIERTQIFTHLAGYNALDWSKLLNSSRILIIAEAGSGKTYECQQEQKRLWDEGHAAFFLELAELASSSSLTELLSSGEETRLEHWRESQSGVATFFLDSFDELQLTQNSFRKALVNLEKALKGLLGRVRIIITTRPVPFDREKFKQYLPFPEAQQEREVPTGEAFAAEISKSKQFNNNVVAEREDPIWRSVCLMPLSSEQISEMIRVLNIANPDELMAAIRLQNVEEFTHRPLDLIELCEDWREHQQIRAHRKQLENNIRIKLKPRLDSVRQEIMALSPEKALDGASRLALACVLSRKFTLRHSVESDVISAADSALDPADILTDWDEKERKTLLERALFGIANYGRVRFHHRSVIEFLAAQQLNQLLKSGMAMKTLKRLLFAQTPQSIKVIKPSMRAVAAWLAADNSSVFDEVLSREPEVLLDFADPESFSSSQRRQTLRAYVECYQHGGWRGMHTASIQIQRFAHAELASLIRELWDVGIENMEVRELLIDVIGSGEINQCADLACAAAINPTEEQRVRRSALETLGQLNDSCIFDVVANMQQNVGQWPEQLLKTAIVSFFPSHVSLEQLEFLLKHTSERVDEVGLLGWQWPRLIAAVDITPILLNGLRHKLSDLILENAEFQEGWRFSTSRPHLLHALAACCVRQLVAGERSEALFKSAIVALRFSKDGYASQKEPINILKQELAALPTSYREVLFWLDIALTQSFEIESNPWSRIYRTCSDGPIQLNAEQDGDWVLAKLAEQSRPTSERLLLLELAMWLHRAPNTDRKQYAEFIRPLVIDQQELVEHLNAYMQPISNNPELEVWEKQHQEAEKRRQREEEQNYQSWLVFWEELSSHPEKAFATDLRETTAWQLWKVARDEGNDKFSGWNRPFFEKHFNQDVVERLRVTLMAIWRKDSPPLRCERLLEEKNITRYAWLMGLAGIYAEAEDPSWASRLSHAEALVASRFALIELNHFPAWLTDLAITHPTAVTEIFAVELASELSEPVVALAHHHVLQCLQYESQAIVLLLIPQLAQWFATSPLLRESECEYAVETRLRMVVNLLMTYGAESEALLVKQQAKNQLIHGLNSNFSSVWLPVLLCYAPEDGVRILIDGLEGHENEADSIGVRWIAELFGGRHQKQLFELTAPGFTPELLLELLRLAYRNVRIDEDITHEGVYSPGPRDNAQDGRSYLLDAVLNLGGADGWRIKATLIEDPLFVHFRDRALVLAKERAAKEMDEQVYETAQIVKFLKKYEIAPANNDEFFVLMCDRLDDLDDLLLRDDSPREQWAEISEEKIMRRAIAHELSNRANEIYKVNQEEVTADEKETDIRLHIIKPNLESVIELKLGDKHSGRVLRDTLDKQLVSKYMAPENRRAGCLLVTVTRDQNWDHPETGAKLDVAGLRLMLEEEARRIESEKVWSLKLAVKVLDLRPRLPKENTKQKN
ncbi:NACHT domain-containing protein [Deefgea rivuli]|uniref:NACHT domain-containing protein n=1 Tax=Deefgea rivuli TaxID=400948 RepID=UPI00056AA4D3|nr:hypothetical protein [Deefgea rivuli]